jgi:hypothetical protein
MPARYFRRDIPRQATQGCDVRPEALTTPTEEEQLEPFHKLLEGSAGVSEVATARSSLHSIDTTNQDPRCLSMFSPSVAM